MTSPRWTTEDQKHHGRLLASLSVLIAVLDLVTAATMTASRFTAIAVTLLFAAAAALAVFVLCRLGAQRTALALLVGSRLLVPPVFTLGGARHDEAAVLALAASFMPAILIGSAFMTHRALLATGALATLLFYGTTVLLRGCDALLAFESSLVIVSTTGLAAVATKHRDRLDIIHQSELRASNAELLLLRGTLEHRVEERTKALLAAEKMAAIGRLSAGIAHELSSPLAALLGSVDDLRDLIAEYQRSIGDPIVELEDHRAMAREMEEVLGTARRASEWAITFVRSVKAQTRVSSSKVEEFDIAELVRDCVNVLAHAARAARCTVRTSIEEPFRVAALPTRLRQALTNLLQNAIDATADRGGGPVEIRVSRNGGNLLIGVHDQAGGIADDVLPHIFEPLFTTKPYGRGTGLGLAIVKEAVEEDLGGSIRVHTVVGSGTAFLVEVPLNREVRTHAA